MMDNSVDVIGVGKKCCWCCSSLASALRTEHPLISFQGPESHGLIFPWVLPTIGISVPVAQYMETALIRMWLEEALKFASERLRFPNSPKGVLQSAMSSPPGTQSEMYETTDS